MLFNEEAKTVKIILAIINVYGSKGLKLKNLEQEFKNYCGFPLPYKQFGNNNLRSWLLTLPDIYLVNDENDEETLFQHSEKSYHIRQLIYKQKSNQEKTSQGTRYGNFPNNKRNNFKNYKNGKSLYKQHINNNISHIHQSINTVAINETDRFREFNKLVSVFFIIMFDLLYYEFSPHW